MKKRKLVSKVLTMAMALTLTFNCVPLNLTASAIGGVGGGSSLSGGGGGSTGNNDSLLNQEVGLRFSLVTLKDGARTVIETNSAGKYFIDIWCYDKREDLATMYNSVTTNTRYATESGEGVNCNNIIYDTAPEFNAIVNGWLNSSYGGSNVTANFNIASVLYDCNNISQGAIFNEWLNQGKYAFSVKGEKFYNWALDDTGVTVNGKPISNMEVFINRFYSKKLGSLDLNNTFLTVEPVIYYADLETGNQATGTESVASLYGYIARQQSRGFEPGSAWAIHGRLAKLANGFRFGTISSDDGTDVTGRLSSVLGLQIPDWSYTETASFFSFENKMDEYGHGIQAFWLKDMDDPSTPIDTYDITSTPQPQNTPSNPETPSEDNKTDGEKTIIKVYADLYKDPNTGYYTQIENIVDPSDNDYAFIQTDTSNRVSITDEEQINGYKVSAWYTSNTKYDPASSNNDLLKASNMISTTNINIDDNSVSLKELGGNQFRINQYQAAYTSSNKQGYNADGGQHYYAGLSAPHGANGQGNPVSDPNGSTNYTNYKRLAVTGNSNYGTYDYQINEDGTTVDLSGDENTIVILYTREKTYIQTNDIPNSDIPDNPDDRIDQSGNLTIV